MLSSGVLAHLAHPHLQHRDRPGEARFVDQLYARSAVTVPSGCSNRVSAPIRSVRKVFTWAASRRSSTSARGWPKVLCCPTLMRAALGGTAARKSVLVEVRLP